MKLRNVSESIVALAAVLLVSSGATLAQPTRETDEGVFVTLPERVRVSLDGSATLMTREIGPIPRAAVEASVPLSVPVWTVLDGREVRGVVWPMGPAAFESPSAVVIEPNGYRLLMDLCVTYSCFNRGVEPKSINIQPLPAPLGLSVPVLRSPDGVLEDAEARGGGFELNFLPEANTYPPGQAAAIGAALFRIEQRFERLLSNDGGFCRIRLAFNNAMVPPGSAAATTVRGSVLTYTQVKNNLIIHAQVDKEPNAEIVLYEQLPPGASIAVKYSGQAPTTTPNINVSNSLLLKWNFPVDPDHQALTWISTAFDWDYNSLDGVPANAQDFEKAVTHEVIHALGFGSLVEFNPGLNQIALWDVFRLDRDQVGPTVSLTEINTFVRMLDAAAEVVGALFTGSPSGIARLSRGITAGGDERQAAHWKSIALLHKENPAATIIGIMDPDGGAPGAIPGYMSPADRAAIDQFGWNVNPSAPQPPNPDGGGQPPNGQDRVPYAPLLSWTNGSGALSRNLYIYQGAAITCGGKIYEVIGVSGTAHQVPPGALQAGATYLWFTTSINDFAYTHSPHRTFTTLPACEGDADGDRDRDFADISNVLTNFGMMYQPAPPGVFPGDANGNGAVDFADVTAVLTSFGLACP